MTRDDSKRDPPTAPQRVRAYVGLGANVGEAEASLVGAVAALATLPRARLVGVSDLYRTRPVGVEDQPDFLNAAVALDVPRGPDPATGALALLLALKSLERAFGRRQRQRWGSRELDLDLLAFGRHRLRVARTPETRSPSPDRSDGQWLEVPHPAARDRLFVLAPLSDLAPGLRPPGWGSTVASARAERERVEGVGAVDRVGRWDPAARRWKGTPRRAPPRDD